MFEDVTGWHLSSTDFGLAWLLSSLKTFCCWKTQKTLLSLLYFVFFIIITTFFLLLNPLPFISFNLLSLFLFSYVLSLRKGFLFIFISFYYQKTANRKRKFNVFLVARKWLKKEHKVKTTLRCWRGRRTGQLANRIF